MIIDSMSIGPNYRKLTVAAPGATEDTYLPGQCVVLEGRYFALAGARTGQLDVVVPERWVSSWRENSPMRHPVGPGFEAHDSPTAHVVVGGTGISAAVSLVRHRSQAGLDTVVQFVGRSVRRSDVVAAFPLLEEVDLDCWDTSEWGRPMAVEMLPPHVIKSGVTLFFAGPRSLLDELTSHPARPKLHLNTREEK